MGTTVIEAKRMPVWSRWLVRRAVYVVAGKTYVAIETRLLGENFEVYSSVDGLETFVGYLRAVARTAPSVAMGAVEALAEAR